VIVAASWITPTMASYIPRRGACRHPAPDRYRRKGLVRETMARQFDRIQAERRARSSKTRSKRAGAK